MTAATQEEIRVGALAIRFLVDGQASGGTVAVFEFDVPAGAKLPVAHSHDAYEETVYGLRGTLTWTIEGSAVEAGPGRPFASRVAPSIASTTMAPRMRPYWRSSRPASSGRTTSASSPRSSRPRPAARPIPRRSPP